MNLKLFVPAVAALALAGCGSSGTHATTTHTTPRQWFHTFVTNYNQQVASDGVSNATITDYDTAMFGAARALCQDLHSGASDAHMDSDVSTMLGAKAPSMMVNAMIVSLPNSAKECPK